MLRLTRLASMLAILSLVAGCSMSPDTRDAIGGTITSAGEALRDAAGAATSIPDLILWGLGAALTSIGTVVGASKLRRRKSTAARLAREDEVDERIAALEATAPARGADQ